MQATPEKLSVVEKIGYSLGDAAANFVFMTMILFQANFYTDVMGIAVGDRGLAAARAAAVGRVLRSGHGRRRRSHADALGPLPPVDSVHGAALGRRDVPGVPDAGGLEHAARSSPTRSSRTCC